MTPSNRSMNNSTKPHRLRPRFTLGALLLLITVISPPLAYIAQRRAWNATRNAAYEHLLETGAFRSTAVGTTPNPPKITTWSRVKSAILLEGRVPPIDKITIFDVDGPKGSQPSPSDSDLRLLAYFPETREVHISHAADVTDDGLSVVAKLPKLKSIELLAMPYVKGGFLKELANSKELTYLTLDTLPALEGEALAVLNKLPNLHFLKLFLCPKLSDESLRNVSLPPSVNRVSFAELDIGDETIMRWLNQTQLLNLTLNVDITRRIAPALARQTDLESLCIINAPLEDPDFEFLSQCGKLSQLVLSGIPVEGAFLKSLKAAPSISYIDLSSTLLTDEHAAELRRCEKLNALSLNFTPIQGECFAAGPWPPIASVYLIGAEFSDLGKDALVNLKGPKEITLPINWEPLDSHRAFNLNGKLAYRWLLMWGGPHTGGMSNATNYIGKVDRSSPERMAPVLRLHDAAR